jgi:hypothetical protein
MEVETRRSENGTEITVKSDSKVAIVVEGDEERIYLPEPGGTDSTYYAGKTEGIESEGDIYTVLHKGEAENIDVFAK